MTQTDNQLAAALRNLLDAHHAGRAASVDTESAGYVESVVDAAEAALAAHEAAQAERPGLLELLEGVEWYQPSSNSSPSCPWCGRHQHMGHAADCALAAAIAAVPQAAAAQHDQLMRFYGVSNAADLIAVQARHIEKLQAKLPPAPSLAPQRVREG